MNNLTLVKIFEHNLWANQQIIQACYALSDEQLDAEPQSATKGSIRQTLTHCVRSQQGYLNLLTIPLEDRPVVNLKFAELQESARQSGEGLLRLVQGEAGVPVAERLRTRDGYLVEPWVVLLQAINHATEHREQIKSMLSALGITPPEIAGWEFGEADGALAPSKE